MVVHVDYNNRTSHMCFHCSHTSVFLLWRNLEIPFFKVRIIHLPKGIFQYLNYQKYSNVIIAVLLFRCKLPVLKGKISRHLHTSYTLPKNRYRTQTITSRLTQYVQYTHSTNYRDIKVTIMQLSQKLSTILKK